MDESIETTKAVNPNQCHAYSPDLVRCTKDAPHPGEKHSVAVEWDDDECWTPIKPREYGTPHVIAPAPIPMPYTINDTPLRSEPPMSLEPCVACGHNHRGGECARCGCHNHI